MYRIEIAKSSRAGCHGSECKKEKTKIQKGELRFGTYVEIHEHGAFQWRHLKCVTDKVWSNVVKALDGLKIPEDLDGYEDLDSESQSQVEAVFKEHLQPKDDQHEEKPPKGSKRKRAIKKEEEVENDTKSKKRAIKKEEEVDNDAKNKVSEEVPKPKRTRKTKVEPKADGDDTKSDLKVTKKRTTKSSKTETSGVSEATKETPKKPKRVNAKQANKKDNDDERKEEVPKKKRVTKKVKKETD